MEGQSAFKDNSGLPTIDLVSIAQALVVAECLSFHRAARVLGNEPSTVGRRVRALEDVLGVRSLSEPSLACGLQLLERAFSNKPVLFFDNSTMRFRSQALPVAAS